ncbi:MAG: hypothetical protein AVDCRST_MAG33-1637, partial [uncultured Thermomicrobiales bacterium]
VGGGRRRDVLDRRDDQRPGRTDHPGGGLGLSPGDGEDAGDGGRRCRRAAPGLGQRAAGPHGPRSRLRRPGELRGLGHGAEARFV